MQTSKFRGHKIYCKDGEWFYKDTDEPVVDNRRNCGYCGKADTIEGYDGCIGGLPNIMNACCGHGIIKEAYIQFQDGLDVRGVKALIYIYIFIKKKNFEDLNKDFEITL